MTLTSKGTARAKVFKNGRSQAVRLPKEFRLAGDEVLIRREGDSVILEPIKQGAWPRGYWKRLQEINADFAAAPMRVHLQDVDLDEQ